MRRLMLSLLVLVVGHAAPAVGCMNHYKENVAAVARSRSILEQLQKHETREDWKSRTERLRKELAAGGDYRIKNDLATSLAYIGKPEEAVELLEQIETEKPGLYQTAANLGTAYELTGNNDKALEWIRRGIERNAESHNGTEWLHVRILEAKLAMGGDLTWLENHSILDAASTDPFSVAALGNRGEALSSDQVKAALIYQLHERLQFVKPPDAIVATLLLVLGDIVSEEPIGPGGATEVYELARTYFGRLKKGDRLPELALIRAMTARNALRSPTNPAFQKDLLIVVAALGLLLSLLVIWLKRRLERRFSSRKSACGPEAVKVPSVTHF